MPQLLITKNSNDVFSFVLDGDYSNEIKNIRNDLLTVGNFGHFKTANGANLIKIQNVTPSDVTIVDGSTTLNPTTTDQLFSNLISVGYFDWIFNSGGSGAVRFTDLSDTFQYFGNNGKIVVVDEAQMKLIPITFYNVSKFTELSDVPNAQVAGKYLMSNGTSLIFTDLPPAPTDPNALPNGGYSGTGQDLANAIDNLQDQVNNLTPFTGLNQQIEFTATGGETTIDIGTDALVKSWFWDGSPQAKSQWSQSGSVLTFAFPLSTGSFNIFI